MKSRPILYSTQMVQAILKRYKTNTRRTRGLDKINENPNAWQLISAPIYLKGIDYNGEYVFYNPTFYDEHNGLSIAIKCPYGQIGDQLWVRETFYVQPGLWAQNHDAQPLHYAADGLTECLEDYIIKPSIFMPRWASRITTENTKIRVERVQEISEEDAISEGVLKIKQEKQTHPNVCLMSESTYKYSFHQSWDSLNAKRGYSWEFNPWVWVIEFKEIK